MGIEMPAEVRWLIPIVVGDDWPEGDETALQRLAEVWRTAATDIDDAMREAEDAVKEATSHMDGEAAEAFKKYWEQFVKGEEATLPKMKNVSERLSTACRNCAMQIEYAKLSIIIALVVLAIQIAMMIASAVGTFGASTAGIVPAQLATRAGVQIIFRQLVQRLMQQVGRNLLGKLAMQVGIEVATSVATDLAVQGIQLAKGTRDTVDTNLTLDAAKSGLISGVVGFGVGEGMGKALGDGLGDSIGRSISRNAAEGAITGMGSAVVEGALSEEGIKLDDVLKAGHSGAIGGAAGTKLKGDVDLGGPIDVPDANAPRSTSTPDAPPRMDAPPAPSAPTASSSSPDAPPPPRAADAMNTSFASPPVEQPPHRPATPDTAPASSAPPPAQPPQGFQQGPAQSAPAAPRPTPTGAPSSFGPTPHHTGSSSPASTSPGPHAGPNPSGHGGPPPNGHGGPPPNGHSGPPPNGHSGPPPNGHSGPPPNGHSSPPPNGHSSPPPNAHSSPPPNGHSNPAPGATPSTPSHGTAPAAPATPVSNVPPHPVAGGHTPPGPGQHAPAGPAPGVHALNGPPPPGPAPHPNQAPPQRPLPTDSVHQAATSPPVAPAPFTAQPNRTAHDAPSWQQPAAPAHVPPQQGHAPPPRQASPTHAPHHAPPPAPRQAQPHHAPAPQPRPAHPEAPAPQRSDVTPHTGSHAETAAPAPDSAPRTDHPHQAELDRIKRNSTPVTLPEGLRHLEPWAKRTDAGLSLHVGQSSPYHDTARRVAPDPNRFTVDIHGDSSKVSIGDTSLTPKQLADVIRGGGWDGEQPIRLISCQTGRENGGFAAALSKELGVDVVAPNKDVWVDLQGNVFASSSHLDPNNAVMHKPGWPPNGDWVTFKPDGSTHNHNRPTPPDHTPTWGDVPPEAASKAWRRNWPSPNEQPPPAGWQNRPVPGHNPPPRPPRDPRLDWSRQPPPPRPGFGPPPGTGRQPVPRPGSGHPPMPGSGYPPVRPGSGHPPMPGSGHQPTPGSGHPSVPGSGHQPTPGSAHPSMPPGSGRPPVPPPGAGRAPIPPQSGHRQPPPPPLRPGPPTRPNGPLPTGAPGNFGPPGHRPPPPPGMPPQGMPPQGPLRHTEPGRPQGPSPVTPNHLPGGPVPNGHAVPDRGHEQVDQRTPEQSHSQPTPARQPQEPPYPTRRKTEADYNREAVMRSAKSAEPAPAPQPDVVRRPRWSGDLTVEFLDGTLQEQFQRDRVGGGKVLYESELAHDFEPGDLPPGLTTEIPPGAYDHMATRVDLAGVYLDELGGQPVHRDRSAGMAFLDEPLFRMDDREYQEPLADGHQPRNAANLGMGAHIGDTIRGQGSAFVSFSPSPEATIQRNQTTAGDGLIMRHSPEQVAQTGVAITRVQYMHEGYHPYGIDSDASYVNAGRKKEGGHRESEYLFPGGFPSDHIYRIWPRVTHFDVNGNVIKIEALPPIINENFRWINEMRARR